MDCRCRIIPFSMLNVLRWLPWIASSCASRRRTESSIAKRRRSSSKDYTHTKSPKLRSSVSILMKSRVWQGIVFGCLFLTAGCRQDMHNQPKFKPYRDNPFFADGRSARPLVEDVVARDNLQEDEHLYKGRENGSVAKNFPFPITEQVLRRGQER